MRKLNKKGISPVVLQLIGGTIALFFLLVFAFVFIAQLTGTNLLAANSIGANATSNLQGNFSAGVDNINTAIPTVFSIAAFVLIVVVLLIAWVVARRNGLVGGGTGLG